MMESIRSGKVSPLSALLPALAIAFCAAAPTAEIRAAEPQLRSEMLVSTDWLQRRINDRRLIVIEVGRDRGVYESGHIPNARWLDVASILTERNGVPAELPPLSRLEEVFISLGIGERDRVVLYSRESLLAERAYFTLDFIGHGARVSLLDGGFTRWNRENRRLSTTAPAFTARDIHLRPQPCVYVRHSALKEILAHENPLTPYVRLLDARSPESYRGTAVDAAVPRPGRIPGAVNVYWRDYLAADGRSLLPPDQLRQLHDDAGLRPDRPVIVYCRTGMEASMSYFILRYLGFSQVILYDGSFSQWSQDLETPVMAP
jgi:thiosulfate/3-mercaptopyruvate sulfurtransferase